MSRGVAGVTELHLHLEGSVFPATAVELARNTSHPWAQDTAASLRNRFRYGSFDGFLERIRSMCGLLGSVEALRRVARELSMFLGSFGVLHAEVYVSPYIYMKGGMRYDEIIDAVLAGFTDGEESGGTSCFVLLDSVRHWGVDAAVAVLGGAEAHPRDRVIGFGLGGSEFPELGRFRTVFERATSLGLRRVVHVGETGEGRDVLEAIETLGVERIAHGFRALECGEALALLRDRRIPLDLAVTSNYRTGVVVGEHPIRRLLDEGLVVTLSTDDPSLFRTDPVREYRRARRFGRLTTAELRSIAVNGIEASFADEKTKAGLREELARRFGTEEES